MFLRSAFIAAVSLVAVTAAAASEATRAPSAYASLTTPNAAACARACAEDGICMAWSFHADNQCQLSAVVSQSRPQALAAGFASRAPVHLLPPVAEAEAAPPSPAPALAGAAAAEEAAVAGTQEDDLVLLGAPGEGDLRLGLR